MKDRGDSNAKICVIKSLPLPSNNDGNLDLFEKVNVNLVLV